MEHLSLSPATQAVLTALAELGQATVHELANNAGKARSTTDKAIKTLADAGLIVTVDTGADPADGTPTHWALSEPAAAARDAADLSDEPTAGTDETDLADPDTDASETGDPHTSDGDGEPDALVDDPGDQYAATNKDDGRTGEGHGGDESSGGADPDDAGATAEGEDHPVVVQSPRVGDRKVMAIKGVLADHSDGAAIEVIVAESGISHPTTIRLLAAMEQADAARRLPGQPERWIPGPTKASDVDPNPEPPRCPLCFQVIRGVTTAPRTIAAVLSLVRPDGTLHVIGPDDEMHIVALPTRLAPRSPRHASATGRRADVTVNADGSRPFGRGELEKLTISVLADNPGRPMTPQQIATAISAKLGRTVSSGAVRNNCTKAAAAGSILLAAETPLTFILPGPPHSNNAEVESRTGVSEQPGDSGDPDADMGNPGPPDGEQNGNGS